VRALASHRAPGGDLLSLMRHGLEAYRRELQKERFGVGRKQRHVRTRREPSATVAVADSTANTAAPLNGDSTATHAVAVNGAATADDALLASDRHGAASVETPANGRETEGTGVGRRSRHIPAAVAREVYLRDGGECTFCAEDGRRCGARRFLELDHVTPWAAGGESTALNLRLRCRAHNQHAAVRYFGSKFSRAVLARRRKMDIPAVKTG